MFDILYIVFRIKRRYKMAKKTKKTPWGLIKAYLSRVFIDGLSGMALGLFSTLIVGTILKQLGAYIPGDIGIILEKTGAVAQIATGVGIGCGVAVKLGAKPLVIFSAAVCGFVGAFASRLPYMQTVSLSGAGDPLNAFIAAYVCVEIGSLIAEKTKIDIILTPLVSVFSGSLIAFITGDEIADFNAFLGGLVEYGVQAQPILAGIIVSVLMGMFLTLPISSAAISVILNLSGIAAGAATVGCCANMIGFAVISYRENKMGGLLAQGLGTSMLQMPNILKKPLIWIPPIITSAILGPLSTTVLKMTNTAAGAGMGTAGLVGPLLSFTDMTSQGQSTVSVLIKIALMYFILPAVISLAISEGMRKAGAIKSGDMKLNI